MGRASSDGGRGWSPDRSTNTTVRLSSPDVATTASAARPASRLVRRCGPAAGGRGGGRVARGGGAGGEPVQRLGVEQAGESHPGYPHELCRPPAGGAETG